MRKSYFTEDDQDDFARLLIGHTVSKVAERTLVLDNGIRLTFTDTDGGCSCGAGCYDLTELNGCDNIITKVELYNSPAGDNEDGEGVYRIFVYADNRKINLASWEGTDGNGYYGTGYAVEVSRAED